MWPIEENKRISHVFNSTVEKGGGEGGKDVSPILLPGAKFFFHVKSENIEFWHVNNMWGISFFTEQGKSDKK